jgi:hypothetical protein
MQKIVKHVQHFKSHDNELKTSVHSISGTSRRPMRVKSSYNAQYLNKSVIA